MSTTPARLDGARILILEDDYYLATDLQDALEFAGATVLGPCPDAAEAARFLQERAPDCAFIDVNLGRGASFDVPRELLRRAVPFAFVTGYDADAIPDEFKSVERVEKPVNASRIAGRLLAKDAPTPAWREGRFRGAEGEDTRCRTPRPSSIHTSPRR